MLDSYLRSCCSLAGMILHLDLLNYGEAVDRLSNCLLLSVFPYIHFTQHGAAAVSVRSIPWLQPTRVDECTLQSQITVTSSYYHSSCSWKHLPNDTRTYPSNSKFTCFWVDWCVGLFGPDSVKWFLCFYLFLFLLFFDCFPTNQITI